MSKRALIIANGELTQSNIDDTIANFDIIFACDGAVHQISQNSEIDYICGDFDSVTPEEAAQKFPQAQLVRLENQQSADLEKTIAYACERGAGEITVIGATGGRIDHTLATLSLLCTVHLSVKILIVDRDSAVIALSPECIRGGNYTLELARGETISLASFSDAATVTITGVEWPLHRQILKRGTHGVSNSALGGKIEITVHHGTVLVTAPYRGVAKEGSSQC